MSFTAGDRVVVSAGAVDCQGVKGPDNKFTGIVQWSKLTCDCVGVRNEDTNMTEVVLEMFISPTEPITPYVFAPNPSPEDLEDVYAWGVANLREEPDAINPDHYKGHPSGTEAIEIIQDAPTYNLGAALKYIWRVSWGSKGKDIEDLKKAVWYLEQEVRNRERDL